MRTTITLEPDVQDLVRQAMREQNAPFKRVVNDALRKGLRNQLPALAVPFVQPVFNTGEPLIEVTSFNQLYDELEVDDFIERMGRDLLPRGNT